MRSRWERTTNSFTSGCTETPTVRGTNRKEPDMKKQTRSGAKKGRKTRSMKPVAVGTGLIALDIVLSEVSGEPPRHWAGGTCGNVLAALAYLGWQTLPVARLHPGGAANRIRQDLKTCGVSDRFLG